VLYRIVFAESAQKELRKITKPFGLRILRAIEKLAHNPRPAGCKKLVESDSYRIRINDYRVIYTIKDSELIIDVIKIAHRKQVYR